jgi:hypothetical protein
MGFSPWQREPESDRLPSIHSAIHETRKERHETLG